jgi:hypothetical protein
MAVQRNPIAGTSTPNTSTENSLQRNGFRIATSSKEQIQDGLDWWAGETGGTQLIIYSTKSQQAEAYPGESSDYTPVAWGSFNDLSDGRVIELINGLPGRPANTQYTSLVDAVDWLQSTNQYFMMNQDYPFIKTRDPLVIWDPSVPQCSGFGVIQDARISQNLGNPDYIGAGGGPSTFQPTDKNLLDFLPNGGTAYGTFKATTRATDSVIHGNQDCYLNDLYNSTGGWTATVVFKHDTITNNEAPLFCLGNPSTNGFVVFLTNPSAAPGIRINFGNLSDGINQVNYTFNADEWYHVVVRYTEGGGGQIDVWINGFLIGFGGFSCPSYNWTSPHSLQLGGQRETGAIQPNTASMEIGLFILDNRDAGTDVAYNYNALFGDGINAKY